MLSLYVNNVHIQSLESASEVKEEEDDETGDKSSETLHENAVVDGMLCYLQSNFVFHGEL